MYAGSRKQGDVSEIGKVGQVVVTDKVNNFPTKSVRLKFGDEFS